MTEEVRRGGVGERRGREAERWKVESGIEVRVEAGSEPRDATLKGRALPGRELRSPMLPTEESRWRADGVCPPENGTQVLKIAF